jgi:hypothetical protein
MGLFNRQPRDLAEISDEAQRKESKRAESDRRYEELEQRKYAAKGIKRVAKTISLQNLRPLSVSEDELVAGVPGAPQPQIILDAVEGDLLVDGHEVTVSLLADATIRHSTGVIASLYEYREAFVYLIAGKELLGYTATTWSTNMFSPTEDSYHPAFSVADDRAPDRGKGKAGFLASLHQKLQRQLAPAPASTGDRLDVSAPELSRLETATGEPALSERETSLDI